MSDTIVTRFAPSPTGFLHIGGARTALFNYLFSRHHNGKFLLRIEDTDQERSTKEAIDAILSGLKWLGLEWDEEAIFQSARIKRHQEIVADMLEKGVAYQCYASKEELENMRETARAEGRPPVYNGLWRDRDPNDAPHDISPVIRLKSELEGETIINDLVQGEVRFKNQELDDLILLRSDGTPTYMLAVVVDDFDMGVTHIIRGDDHLNNAARQAQIYKALGWSLPQMAHIPLIHGADGAKLSKRHGALGVEAYQEMGLLPDALLNYLARLGWAHGDQEIFQKDELVNYFTLEKVSKGASRLDFDKLNNVNAQHLRALPQEQLFEIWQDFISQCDDEMSMSKNEIESHKELIIRALPFVTQKAKTLKDLTAQLDFLFLKPPFEFSEMEMKHFTPENHHRLERLLEKLQEAQKKGKEDVSDFDAVVAQILEEDEIKLGKWGPAIRLAVAGSAKAPGLSDIFIIYGIDEVINRLKKAL